MEDASRLVLLAEAFTNVRAQRTRTELRERVGAALRHPAHERAQLDCAESDEVFVVLKPGGRLERDKFDQHEPLLRQAIVAGCAATETYLADRAITRVRQLVNNGQGPTSRTRRVVMTYAQWLEVEAYERRRRIPREPKLRIALIPSEFKSS